MSLNRGAAALAALLTAACGGSEDESEFAPDAPIVIESRPRDGEVDVDPALERITATFSETMDVGGWSWVKEVGRNAPEITGLPHYVNATTTVLPVRLEPATAYVVWLNSPDDAALRKFMNHEGISARAHRIQFTTRSQ